MGTRENTLLNRYFALRGLILNKKERLNSRYVAVGTLGHSAAFCGVSCAAPRPPDRHFLLI